eukprot:g3137.t1
MSKRSATTIADCSVDLPAGALGVTFGPDKNGKAAVIEEFTFLPSGGQSVLKDRVPVGAVLVGVNDHYVHEMDHSKVLRLLKKTANRPRKLFFRDAAIHYLKNTRSTGLIRHEKYASAVDFQFQFAVVRARVRSRSDVTGTSFSTKKASSLSSSSYHAEYEIKCQAPFRSNKVQSTSTMKWSTWKRYSDFSKVDKALRSQFGWQMTNVTLPPKTWLSHLDSTFVEKRRAGLNAWAHSLCQVRGICDFHREHSSSQDLRRLVEWDRRLELAKENGNIIDSTGELSTESLTNSTTSPALGSSSANVKKKKNTNGTKKKTVSSSRVSRRRRMKKKTTTHRSSVSSTSKTVTAPSTTGGSTSSGTVSSNGRSTATTNSNTSSTTSGNATYASGTGASSTAQGNTLGTDRRRNGPPPPPPASLTGKKTAKKQAPPLPPAGKKASGMPGKKSTGMPGKKTSSSAGGNAARNNLLASIRGGAKLKKVREEDKNDSSTLEGKKKGAAAASNGGGAGGGGGMAAMMAAIKARRKD